MKKIFMIIVLMLSTFAYSQNSRILSVDDLLLSNPLDGSVRSASAGKNLTYNQVVGSPYADKTFKEAKIADNYEHANIRYNSYKDEIEFTVKDVIMVLPKEEQFKRIEIIPTKQVLVLVNDADGNEGYFYEITNGKIALLKKVTTKFTDFEAASTPYGNDKPASFSTSSPAYYFKVGDKLIAKPRNSKQFIENFPEQKESLNIFFKENKIKFDKEFDLLKLVKFMNM